MMVHADLIGGLLFLISLANANPSLHDSLGARQFENEIQSGKLLRREISIEDSGLNSQNTPSMNVVTTVPLSNGASSNSTITGENIIIPHTTLAARPYALGGGDGQTFGAGKFQGQLAGCGTRNEIYGNSRYGSGFGKYTKAESGTYTYAPDLSLNMEGRTEFAHGFPPISWGNYSGSVTSIDEGDIESNYPGITSAPYEMYGQYEAKSRLQAIIARKGEQKWFIAADGATMKVLSEVLVLPPEQGGCGIEPMDPLALFSTTTADEFPCQIQQDLIYYMSGIMGPGGLIPLRLYQIYPWNVLQYYRGCSVMLGSNEYNNTFAYNDNNNMTDYWASSPLNMTGVDMNFLQCLNTTIAAAVPIIDPGLVVKDKPKLKGGAIAGIVVGSIAGVVLLIAAAWFLYRRHRNPKMKAPSAMYLANPEKSNLSYSTSAEQGAMKDAKGIPSEGHGYTKA
jgi:hypothetical protein